MKNVNEIIAADKKAKNDYDAYNTTAKRHTIEIQGQTMVADEMICGCIKINGTEQFANFEEMKSCLHPEAKIETKLV